MKTLTEFFGKNLRSIEEQMTALTSESFTTASAALAAEGKSAEELAAALPEAAKAALNAKLGELTKLEGDKLTWFLNALELVKGNRGNLKRVIVMQTNEGEKAPADAKEIDGKYYTVEFFAEAPRATPERGRFGDRDRGGRGGRRGERGGRGPRGDRDDRGPRRPRGERTEGEMQTAADGEGAATEGRRSRRPRRARGEGAEGQTAGGRPPRAPRPPRPELTPEQKAERDAKRAEKEAARAAKKAEIDAKIAAALASEPPYDGKTNRIRPLPPGAPRPAPVETASQASESAASQSAGSTSPATETSSAT